ncbi:TetR/AcrR family transcriptional regulator [Labrys okinawensis]|uniref:TetR/AcrR family transcriptional regulator n=1 Tax=Labrys okinawensis TaxID=346911 RepID=A0A2S9QAT2_9HYPH|nr:WHG domain-containing protein [Labrys okinawensis]PRH86444.1 TetR/AcrR family transcriptional regulator [Labrys okinawensis]
MAKAKARREELREKLIEAAEKTIVAQGHAALKARALAEEVGCALGAIYTVFPDLAALILAVNARSFALLGTILSREAEAAAAAGGGPRAIANRTLIALANGYLDFAANHGGRWHALFDFRLPDGQELPAEHLRQQEALFQHLETPLAALQPALPPSERALLARSLFSAAHGMVLLGLEGKLVQLPLPYLREQIALVVSAMGRGLESA